MEPLNSILKNRLLQQDKIDQWDLIEGDQHFVSDFDGDRNVDIAIRNAEHIGLLTFNGSQFQTKSTQDLRNAAAGKQSIAKVLKQNTGKGLDSAIKQWQKQLDPQDLIKIGTRRADVLKGTQKLDLIFGRGGNDRIYGRAGKDLLSGEQGNDRLEGEAGNDTLNGDGGRDQLLGGRGSDRLIGDQGADVLTGGKGRDQFRLNLDLLGIDQITDFSVEQDVIEVEFSYDAVDFVREGAISADQFHIGAAAADESDRFIYNSQTGVLSFDADGIGGIQSIQIAQLNTGLAMTHQNIIAISQIGIFF